MQKYQSDSVEIEMLENVYEFFRAGMSSIKKF